MIRRPIATLLAAACAWAAAAPLASAQDRVDRMRLERQLEDLQYQAYRRSLQHRQVHQQPMTRAEHDRLHHQLAHQAYHDYLRYKQFERRYQANYPPYDYRLYRQPGLGAAYPYGAPYLRYSYPYSSPYYRPRPGLRFQYRW